MYGIPIYNPNETDFSTNGRGLLLPTECTIEERARGKWELTLKHPITEDLRWTLIENGCLIKAVTPMRESPMYEIDAFEDTEETITTVSREIWRVKTTTGERLHLRQQPSLSARILSKHRVGTEVVKLSDAGNGWYQVAIVNGGAVGYMYAQRLVYSHTITETLTTTKPIRRDGVKVQPAREQLFRINKVERDTESGMVTASAMHIFYDLRGNLVNESYVPENIPANEAAAHTFDVLSNAHPFHLYATVTDAISGDYGYKSMVETLLDPDEGIAAQVNANVIRDNFDIYLVPDQERDMGVTIRRGKNLVGVTVETDASDVVTRIIPVGRDSEGEDLYLEGTRWVDSPRINEYPVVMTKRVEYDVDVGNDEGEYPDAAAARAELVRLAEQDFANGADLPTYGMTVDFVMLGAQPEYPEYAGLQAVHLYDTVTVIDELIRLKSKVRMTGYVWDVLAEQYESVTLGELVSNQGAIYGFDIAQGSVSGNRLIPNTVPGAMLRDLSVRYAKMDIAAVKQLNAEAVNAISARIDEIAANKITTAELYASLSKIVTLMAENITADTIATDELAAALGDFVALYADFAGLDFAAIKDLDADEAIFRVGVAGEVYIDRLAATSATLVSATLNDLVLKGTDGRYYAVTVQSDGVIGTTHVEPSADEIASGQMNDGHAIVETEINVQDLNAQSVKAMSATISDIFTDALNAGKITAGQAMIASATIPELYTTAITALGNSIDITANSTIQLLIATNDLIRAWYTFTEDGMRVGKKGSTYATLTDDTGFHILQLNEIIGSFAKRQLTAEAIRVGPVNATGPHIVMRGAPDGGIVFVRED